MSKQKNFATHFKTVDLFARQVSFRMDKQDSFGSIFGAAISLVITVLALLYGVNKFIIMSNYDDTSFNQFSDKNGLSEEVFGQD